MKKFLAILVTISILVSSVCIALPSAAADKAVDYVVTANADYATKKVSVTVEMTENSGLTGCIIDLTYDASVLSCTSAQVGSVWSGDVEANTMNDGVVVFYAFPDSITEVNTKTGVVFTAEFELNEGANEDAPFNFALECGEGDADNQFVTENGDLVAVPLNATIAGHKSFADAKPEVVEKAADYVVTAEADYAAKKVSVTVELTKNTGLSSALIDLTYNADVLSCTNATLGSVWAGDVEVNTANKGVVIFYAVPEDMNAVNTNTGVVFTAEFALKAGANENTPFNFALNYGDGDEYNHFVVENGDIVTVPLNATVKGHKSFAEVKPADGAVEFNVTSALEGNKYYVYVDVANNPGIWAMIAKVKYNKEALSFDSMIVGNVFNSSELGNSNFNVDPAIIFAESASMSDNTKCGRMVTLVFNVLNCEKVDDIVVNVDEIINYNGDDVKIRLNETYTSLQHTSNGADVNPSCEVCGKPISGTHVHTPKTVIENIVSPTCTTRGSYDEVVYCSGCSEELSRTTVAVPALGHTEETVYGYEADCENTGLTDGVKCSVCGKIIVAQKVIPALGHEAEEAVKENIIEPTETENGSYELVEYCSVCGKELSRTQIIVEAIGKKAADYTVTAYADYAAKKVTVTVEMTKNTGLSCSIIDLTYNANVLSCTSAKAGSIWSGDVDFNTANNGVVIFYAVPDDMDTVNTNTGVVFTAEFALKAGANENTPFNFALNYGDGDEYNHFVVENGDIVTVPLNATVKGHKSFAEVKPADGAVEFNATSAFEDNKYYVYLDVANNPGIWAMIAKVKYNKAALSFDSMIAGDVFTASELGNSNFNFDPAIIFAESASLSDNTNNGRVVTLVFNVIDSNKNLDIQIIIDECINSNGDDVNVTLDEDYVELKGDKTSLSAISEYKNGKYYVHFDINNNPGIWAMLVSMDYNRDALEFESFIAGDVFTASELGNSNFNADSAVIFAESASLSDNTKDGRIVTLVFNVLDCQMVDDIKVEVSEVINANGDDVELGVVANYAALDHQVDSSAGGSCAAAICKVCGKELSSDVSHTPGPKATCTTEQVCLVCGAVLETALGHTEVTAYGYAADCENDGLTNGIKCSVCGEWITLQTVIPAFGHTPDEAVRENVVHAFCTVDGSYEEVVYCAVCGDEISRTAKVEPALGHMESEVYIENTTPATCTKPGSYYEVIYCERCAFELSRTQVLVPAKGHTAVEFSAVAPTCTAPGHTAYVECSVCGELLSGEKTVIPANGHTPGMVVVENMVKPTSNKDGHYDEVTYCSVCNEQISRTTVIIPCEKVEFNATSEYKDGKYYVHVDIDNNLGIWAALLSVDYNRDALEFDSLIAGDVFTASELASSNFKVDPAIIMIEGASITDNTANGRAFTVVFNVKNKDLTADIRIVVDECINANGDDVAASVTESYDDFASDVVSGDVSGDGKVNLNDLFLLKMYTSGGVDLDDGQREAADLSGDGKITIADLFALKSFIAGN